MTCISASNDNLLRQASMTAHEYMLHAVDDIDRMFGDGYAKKNPQLVASYMQVACGDFATAIASKVIGEALEELASAVRSLSR